MKKRFLVISYFCMIAGTILFLGVLILQSANSQQRLNVQRFVDNGIKTEVVVVDKKVVVSEFVGTFGVSRKTTQYRVYVKTAEQLKKVYWQAVAQGIYNQIEPGSSLTVYINIDEVMIADLVEVSNVLAACLLLAALLMFVVAIVAHKKSSSYVDIALDNS